MYLQETGARVDDLCGSVWGAVIVALNRVPDSSCSAKGGELLVHPSGCWFLKDHSMDLASYPVCH